ncbi:hypothetical protein [uncultured Ferrimonas sp.]|uniref:hypothetical protein n=1 Tax=uncultured Ferrimonas sp. TaxID=432640 RepID=UPI00262D44F7|nr:hypothetical protein [uncultured Ferrimonas sp.]
MRRISLSAIALFSLILVPALYADTIEEQICNAYSTAQQQAQCLAEFQAQTNDTPLASGLFEEMLWLPQKHLGLSRNELKNRYGIEPNEGGNFVVIKGNVKLLFELNKPDSVSFISIDFTENANCTFGKPTDYSAYIEQLGLKMNQLKQLSQIGSATVWIDTTRKLKVSGVCPYDGGPPIISFRHK